MPSVSIKLASGHRTNNLTITIRCSNRLSYDAAEKNCLQIFNQFLYTSVGGKASLQKLEYFNSADFNAARYDNNFVWAWF